MLLSQGTSAGGCSLFIGALTCGANPGSAVTDDYPSPFNFTGTIHSVTVDISGKLIEDTEAELRMHMSRQ